MLGFFAADDPVFSELTLLTTVGLIDVQGEHPLPRFQFEHLGTQLAEDIASSPKAASHESTYLSAMPRIGSNRPGNTGGRHLSQVHEERDHATKNQLSGSLIQGDRLEERLEQRECIMHDQHWRLLPQRLVNGRLSHHHFAQIRRKEGAPFFFQSPHVAKKRTSKLPKAATEIRRPDIPGHQNASHFIPIVFGPGRPQWSWATPKCRPSRPTDAIMVQARLHAHSTHVRSRCP